MIFVEILTLLWLLEENILFKKSTLKYLEVKGHIICNLLSNGSEKKIVERIAK